MARVVFDALPESGFVRVSKTNHAVIVREPKMIARLCSIFSEKIGDLDEEDIINLKDNSSSGIELVVEKR